MQIPLAELYYNSELYCSLRDRGRVIEGGGECDFSGKCRGGLRCLSYAENGGPFRAEPGCWRAKTAGKV